MLELRTEMCRTTGLREEDVPFAGELLQVRAEEQDWEGAIERVLHNFGLSLLVADEHYARVAEWVDRTHLGGRLVYFRVLKGRRTERPALHPASLAHDPIRPSALVRRPRRLPRLVCLLRCRRCSDPAESARTRPL